MDARSRHRLYGSGLVLRGRRQRQHRVKGHHVNLRAKQPGLGVTRGTLEVFLTSQRMLCVAGVLFLHRVQGLRDGAGRRNLHWQHVHRGTAGLRARRTQGAGRLRQGAGEHAVHMLNARRTDCADGEAVRPAWEVSSCSRAPLASQKATSSSRAVEAASSASSSCCRLKRRVAGTG